MRSGHFQTALLLLALVVAVCAARRPSVAKPELTSKQADTLTGLWTLKHKSDGFRLAGAMYDVQFLKALQSGATSKSLKAALEEALVVSNTIAEYSLLITGVHAKSGLVVGYREVPSTTQSGLSMGSAPPSKTWIPYKRIVGYAYAEADGTLVFHASEDVDSAVYYARVAPDATSVMELRRTQGYEVWSANRTTLLAPQNSQRLMLTKEASVAKSLKMMAVMKSSLPLTTNTEGGPVNP